MKLANPTQSRLVSHWKLSVTSSINRKMFCFNCINWWILRKNGQKYYGTYNSLTKIWIFFWYFQRKCSMLLEVSIEIRHCCFLLLWIFTFMCITDIKTSKFIVWSILHPSKLFRHNYRVWVAHIWKAGRRRRSRLSGCGSLPYLSHIHIWCLECNFISQPQVISWT